MANFKALSRGSQLVLVAGPLLLFSLFFTWQNVEVDYGRAGRDAAARRLGCLGAAPRPARHRDRGLVALGNLTDVELSDDVPWPKITLGLGMAILAVAVVKSLTDAGSSWMSYGFVGLAVAVAVGTYLDWAAARKSRRPGSRSASAAGSAQPLDEERRGPRQDRRSPRRHARPRIPATRGMRRTAGSAGEVTQRTTRAAVRARLLEEALVERTAETRSPRLRIDRRRSGCTPRRPPSARGNRRRTRGARRRPPRPRSSCLRSG